MRTNAFYQKINAMLLIPQRQGNGRNWNLMEAIGLVATFTEEMHMLIFVLFLIMTVAELIFSAAVPVFYGMHQMMRMEKHEGTEDIGFVDGKNGIFQFLHRYRSLRYPQGLDDDDTIGGGFDTTLQQQFYALLLIHLLLLL